MKYSKLCQWLLNSIWIVYPTIMLEQKQTLYLYIYQHVNIVLC